MTATAVEQRTDRANPQNESEASAAVREPAIAVSDLESVISSALAPSVLQIDQLMAHLQRTREDMQQEAQRVQREVAEYAQMNYDVRDMIKIISESVSEWRNTRSQ